MDVSRRGCLDAAGRFPSGMDHFGMGQFSRGKALKVAKPAFPPRAPPFRARKLLLVVEMCARVGGAMDSAVLAVESCADYGELEIDGICVVNVRYILRYWKWSIELIMEGWKLVECACIVDTRHILRHWP